MNLSREWIIYRVNSNLVFCARQGKEAIVVRRVSHGNQSITGMDNRPRELISFCAFKRSIRLPCGQIVDRIWLLSRDLNFYCPKSKVPRTLCLKSNLTDGSIKTGGNFHLFGPFPEKLPTVHVQSRKKSNHVHTRVTCKLNSRPPEPRKETRDSGGTPDYAYYYL